MKSPPLTKKGRASKKPKMAAQEDSTILTRKRVLAQYMGFLVKFLHLHATMEHVMDPLLVAKFIGFQEAKGNKPGTINKVREVGGMWHGLAWHACKPLLGTPQPLCALPPLPHRLPTTWPT